MCTACLGNAAYVSIAVETVYKANQRAKRAKIFGPKKISGKKWSPPPPRNEGGFEILAVPWGGEFMV